MADLIAIRNALAAQITAHTGLAVLAQARDQVNPPVAVILPREPVIAYGATMDVHDLPGALTVNLQVIVIITDAAPVDATQRALDTYIGVGKSETISSIPAAVDADPTLGALVDYTVCLSAGAYGRVEYAGVVYFGARIIVEIGTT
jgi:hypothetical protein